MANRRLLATHHVCTFSFQAPVHTGPLEQWQVWHQQLLRLGAQTPGVDVELDVADAMIAELQPLGGGDTHGVAAPGAIFENVPRRMAEGRALRPRASPKFAVVAFRANPPLDLLLACLWSRWSAPSEPDLLSFALSTDEPPPEVLAAGHNRCVIPLGPENLDAWLNPDPKNLLGAFRLLDDRQPVTFAHTLVS